MKPFFTSERIHSRAVNKEEDKMSLVKKFLSSIGVGAARVDTQIHQTEIEPGGKLEGKVIVEGGEVEQNIDRIYLSLLTTYEKEVDDRKVNQTATIAQFQLNDPFTIKPKETKALDFTFTLPEDTPLTLNYQKVWIQTGLDIKSAVDPSDRDYIKVVPHPIMDGVLNSLEELGFRIYNVRNEAAPYRIKRRLPFVQEFEFKAYNGSFAGKLDELEVIFFLEGDRCDLVIEIDRKARGLGGFLSEMLDTDESLVQVTVHKKDIPQLTSQLSSLIRQYS